MAPHPALIEFEKGRAQSAQNRVADWITEFTGSMIFVYVHIVWFSSWILLGVEGYPYGLLTKREVLSQHQWQVIQKEDEQNQHLLTPTQRIHDLSQQIHGLQTQTLDLTQKLSEHLAQPPK